MDQQFVEALSDVANGAALAVSLLARELDRAGVLSTAAYEKALSATINHPGADTSRADYVVLQAVLSYLQQPGPAGSPLPSIRLHVIQGDKP